MNGGSVEIVTTRLESEAAPEPAPDCGVDRNAYARCPRCDRRTMVVDELPSGAEHQLCLDPRCGHEREALRVYRPSGITETRSSGEEDADARAAFRDAEHYLQHLKSEDIRDPEWWLRHPEPQWREEFEECVNDRLRAGATRDEAMRRAAVEMHKLRSMGRAGRVE